VFTRRQLLVSASAIAIAVSVAGIGPLQGVRPAAAQGVPLAELLVPPLLGDRSLGKDDAPVTVVEYASMTCPHCAQFHATTYPELKKRYVDTGKVRFIFREFPLDPLAAGASMLARCADKEQFFPLIETLFQQQRQWAVEKPIPPLMALAKQAGFSEQKFNACLSDQKMLEAMQAELKRASEKFGVASTPTLFVNGRILKGGISIDDLAKVIDPLLKS
jgi:protein-disulfide isomerase